jgi:two-component system heavy metal sensor histidine kinase CusS
MMNLLDNAVKYSNDGGTIRFTCAASGDSCEIGVENTGTPISESEQAHIFDRFYRADRSRSHEQAYELGAGAGLGLAIGRSIARIHGGELSLIRSDSSSTLFSATLPKRPNK